MSGAELAGIRQKNYLRLRCTEGSHTGIDIDGKTGDPICAAVEAPTFAGRQGTYGFMVAIDHGNGLTTRYAHCSSILVKVGQTVSRGEVIARGLRQEQGSHLHFEVISRGSFQNPLRYLDCIPIAYPLRPYRHKLEPIAINWTPL